MIGRTLFDSVLEAAYPNQDDAPWLRVTPTAADVPRQWVPMVRPEPAAGRGFLLLHGCKVVCAPVRPDWIEVAVGVRHGDDSPRVVGSCLVASPDLTFTWLLPLFIATLPDALLFVSVGQAVASSAPVKILFFASWSECSNDTYVITCIGSETPIR